MPPPAAHQDQVRVHVHRSTRTILRLSAVTVLVWVAAVADATAAQPEKIHFFRLLPWNGSGTQLHRVLGQDGFALRNVDGEGRYRFEGVFANWPARIIGFVDDDGLHRVELRLTIPMRSYPVAARQLASLGLPRPVEVVPEIAPDAQCPTLLRVVIRFQRPESAARRQAAGRDEGKRSSRVP